MTQYETFETGFFTQACVSFRIPKWYSSLQTYHNLCIQSLLKDIWILYSLGDYEQSCSKHFSIGFYLVKSFHLSGADLRSGMAGPHGKCLFNFIRNYQTVFQGGCTLSFVYPPGMYESSSCSISLLALDIVVLFFFFNLSHPNRYVVFIFHYLISVF